MIDTDNIIEKKTGVCEKCGKLVDLDVVETDGTIFYIKKCENCGDQRTKICVDTDYYMESNFGQSQITQKFSPCKSTAKGCPYDCGLCEQHRQKICMAMVETTNDCNVHCTTCIAGSCPGGKQYISLDDLQSIINTIKRCQDTIDLLMLSGGEPTIHPLLFDMIDLCKKSGVKHTMIISNGVRFAQDEAFVQEISKDAEHLEIYLQFDSLRDDSLYNIRGPELTATLRRKAVENLEKYGIHYTLVCILKKNVNENEVKEIIEFALSQKFARGVTFQPLKDIGRSQGFDKDSNYITLSEARQLIADTGYIPLNEMIPHPCNGNCISIGYLSKSREPITRYLFNDFKNSDSLKQLMYYLPELDTEEIRYSDLFRITVVSFLDKYNFTLEDVKRCCISFVSSDGNIVPFDTHYVYH